MFGTAAIAATAAGGKLRRVLLRWDPLQLGDSGTNGTMISPIVMPYVILCPMCRSYVGQRYDKIWIGMISWRIIRFHVVSCMFLCFVWRFIFLYIMLSYFIM